MRSKENWIEMRKGANYQEIAEEFNILQPIARLLINRGITTKEQMRMYLFGSKNDMYSPWKMHGMKEAVDLIKPAIREGKRIRIITDYDVDGIMSGYILVMALKKLGANADVDIPDRIADGYGINTDLVEKAASDGIEMIITCDNGISAIEAAKCAKAHGMQFIVTDHHEIPETLPDADVIIDPHQEICSYPYENICGAVVAYKLAYALFESSGKNTDALFEEMIEFAAIATVADVMPLLDENRIIVKEGLMRLRNTQNLGLQALISECALDPLKIDSYHIGFVIGPCLNASGRLSTAKIALSLLLEEDREKVKDIAKQLVELNEERKTLGDNAREKAMEIVDNTPIGQDKVLVVYLPDVHESLMGIIAGRLREAYNKPAFVLTDAKEGELKGSGRSIPAYSMYDELTAVSDYLTRFGGHPAAAGLSLQKENLDAFRKAINGNCHLTLEDMLPKVYLDMQMPFIYCSEQFIEQMDLLKPYGLGNERPLFGLRSVRVIYPRVYGAKRNVVKMQLRYDDRQNYEGIYFGDGDEFLRDITQNPVITVLYYPQINEYNGKRTNQMVIKSYR